jgi:hypothetical protein
MRVNSFYYNTCVTITLVRRVRSVLWIIYDKIQINIFDETRIVYSIRGTLLQGKPDRHR